MANSNFVVQNGLTVGSTTIFAGNGDVITSGNITVTGSGSFGGLSSNQIYQGASNVTVSGSFVNVSIGSTNVASFSSTGLTVLGTTTTVQNETVQGSLTPSSNVAYNLGSPSLYWSNGWIGQVTANTVAATTIGGTLSTAAQPNITSHGTLTGLTVSGATQTAAITSSGTIIAATVNAATIGNSGATLTGTLNTASQSSITTLAGLTSFGTAGVTTTAQGNLSIAGNLVVTGNSVSIGATSLSITDPIINLNTPQDLSPLTVPTTNDIGLKFHYYDTADSSAFAGRTVTDGYFTFWTKGSDTANVFTGTQLGTFKGGAAWFNNTTAATGTTSSTAGALYVAGGAGIAGALYTGSVNSGDVTSSSTIIAATVNAATIGNASATLTGTLQTASQTNITGVGTLTAGAIGVGFTAIPNSALANNSVTVNGTAISLGASGTVTAAAGTLTGSTLASGVTASSLTSVGTLTGLTVTATITGSVSGSAGSATTATTASYVSSPDGDRNASTKLPTTSGNKVRFDFSSASSAGTSGNYAGVMTYAPWDGTTASTGDASYQLAFGSTATNGSGYPKLNIRNGIDSTWNSWYNIFHSGQTNTPSADNTWDLGASGTRYATVYGVTFSGVSTTAKYADLAENYQGDKSYMPGTVVMFGGDAEVTLAVADTKAVAGVVSTNPAHLMNGGLSGPSVVAVALQGRVPCMVIGPVAKGDIMVSAGFGYARVNNNPIIGTIIGKALQDVPFNGKAVIEVVVGRT